MSTVADLLAAKSPGVIGTSAGTTVREAARKMAEANVGCLIIEQYPDILGLVTERDLVRRVVAAGKDPAATPVAEVMSSRLRTCGLQDDVRHCARLMAEHHIHHLVVLDAGELVGVISLRDILAEQLKPT